MTLSISLEQLATELASADSLEDLVEPILGLAQRVTGLESTYLTRIDPARTQQEVLLSHNTGALEIPAGLVVPWEDTLCRRALTEQRFLVTDVRSRWADSEAARALGLSSYLSCPVYLDDGELYGTLCGASVCAAQVDPGAVEVMALFARLIGQQASRDALAKQAERRAASAESRARDLQFAADFTALCLTAPGLGTLLCAAARSIAQRRAWVEAGFFLPATDGTVLQVDSTTAGGQSLAMACLRWLTERPERLKEQRLVVLPAASVMPELDPHHAQSRLALLPVFFGDQLRGGLWLLSTDPALSEAETAMLNGCWHTLTLYAEREHQHQQLLAANALLRLHAEHDPLTGLANRRALIEHLQRMLSYAERTGDGVCVAFIDLDNFKAINDAHGHEVGDQFLCAMATRLQDTARKQDLLSRYGGDEFVVAGLVEAEQMEGAAEALGGRIQHVLTGTIDLEELQLDYGGPSVGVISWQGTQAPDVDDLLAAADKAMYKVKEARRAGCAESKKT